MTALVLLGGCSLSHDFDGLVSGGGGEPGGGGSPACVPRTCADASPSCGAIDDLCGAQLTCGCVAPATCEAGTCACPTVPMVTAPKVPRAAKANTGTGRSWTNVASVKTKADGVAASVIMPPQTHSMMLHAYGFDLDEVPDDASIDRVELTVCRWKEPEMPVVTAQDRDLELLLAGAVMPGTDVATDVGWTFHDGTCNEIEYAWTPDGQSLELTPADVKNDLFGVSLVVRNPGTSGGDVTAKVDWLTLSVSWLPSCTPESD